MEVFVGKGFLPRTVVVSVGFKVFPNLSVSPKPSAGPGLPGFPGLSGFPGLPGRLGCGSLVTGLTKPRVGLGEGGRGRGGK